MSVQRRGLRRRSAESCSRDGFCCTVKREYIHELGHGLGRATFTGPVLQYDLSQR